MESINECKICLTEYNNEKNPLFPIHKTINNDFHFVCYNCFLKLKNVCPFCKSKSDFLIDPDLLINIYDVCKNGNQQLALQLLRNKKYNKIDQIDDKGNTALIWACYNKLSDVALELIKTNQI
jgi:ankyrin repeat protein